MNYKLKGKRVEKGFKQNLFAKELGITPQYLNEIEKGKVFPRIDLAKKISELLEISIQELFF